MLHLPHTAGCLVCGPHNPHGLQLKLHVDPESGIVHVQYTPQEHHNGFVGVIHGGAIAAVLDEAMVWAASWRGKRFCLCGEMTVRFRGVARPGAPLNCNARVTSSRSRLILTSAQANAEDGSTIAEATGKYVPLSPEENRQFLTTFSDDPETAQAAKILRTGL
jgi:acyl-coenzyme A thioesterase PaaI-like protein